MSDTTAASSTRCNAAPRAKSGATCCRCLIAAIITGLVFSVYSAFSQYLTGFDDTLKFIQEKEAKSGVSILEGQFGNRLKESRVSGDFSICNSYGVIW